MYNFSKRKKSLKASEKWGLCPMCNTLTCKRSLFFDRLLCSTKCERTYARERGGPDGAIFENLIDGGQI